LAKFCDDGDEFLASVVTTDNLLKSLITVGRSRKTPTMELVNLLRLWVNDAINQCVSLLGRYYSL